MAESAPADRLSSAPGTFLVILIGLLPLPMSMSGASIAIPHIGGDLDTGGAAAQWVVTGYFLTASVLMIVTGTLADALGRRRIYRWGALVYATGSLLAAMAPSIDVLLAARIVTGAGAAGVMASGGAILAATFTGAARTRAFAAMGAMAGLGLALGPSASGWIIEGLGWRAGFAIFAVAALGLFAGTWLMRESRAAVPRKRARLLGDAGPVGGLLVLLRDRRFSGWVLAAVIMSIGYGGALAFLPSYLQSPGGRSAGETGLIMLLPTVPMIVLPTLAGKLVNLGVRPAMLITVALLLLGLGNAWLTVLHPDLTVATVTGPLLTLGAGVGLAAGIIDAQAMDRIDTDRAGLAAGLLNTVRAGANSLVLAVFGATLVGLLGITVGSSELAGRVATGNLPVDGGAMLAGHLTRAWRIALLGLAAVCGIGAIITAAMVRQGRGHDGRRSSPARSRRHSAV